MKFDLDSTDGGYRSLGLVAARCEFDGLLVDWLSEKSKPGAYAALRAQAARWRGVKDSSAAMPGFVDEAPEFPVPPEVVALLGLDITAEEQRAYCEAARVEDPNRMAARFEREVAEAEPENPVFDFARDFSALRAPDPLIPGLIESGSAVQVIAPPNVGKTFQALAWACDLAARGRAVVYVVGDDSTYQFVRRVLGWCAAHEVKPGEVFAHLQLFTRAAQFADAGDMGALEALVVDREAVMVVFDTMHQCSEGLQENSNDDSRVITAACKRITALGPAVVLVHHAADDGKTGRGAKSVHGYLTTVLSITDVKQEGQRYLKVTPVKQKNMERGEPALYPLDRVEIPVELRGGVIPERDAWTLVARTRTDPFDGPGGDRAAVIADVRRYCILAALNSSPKPLAVTRIAKFTREAAKPMLVARGLLTANAKQMPRGFTEQVITELLKGLAPDEDDPTTCAAGGPPLVNDATSTDRTAYYSLTSEGEDEKSELAERLGITPGNMA